MQYVTTFPEGKTYAIRDNFGIKLLRKIRVSFSDVRRDHKYNNNFSYENPTCVCGLVDENPTCVCGLVDENPTCVCGLVDENPTCVCGLVDENSTCVCGLVDENPTCVCGLVDENPTCVCGLVDENPTCVCGLVDYLYCQVYNRVRNIYLSKISEIIGSDTTVLSNDHRTYIIMYCRYVMTSQTNRFLMKQCNLYKNKSGHCKKLERFLLVKSFLSNTSPICITPPPPPSPSRFIYLFI